MKSGMPGMSYAASSATGSNFASVATSVAVGRALSIIKPQLGLRS